MGTFDIDKLYKEQCMLIDNVPDVTPQVKEQVKERLKHIFSHRCAICGLNGHNQSYCWLNAMMYQQVKNNIDWKCTWWSVKQVAKVIQKQKDAQAKANVKKKVIEDQVQLQAAAMRQYIKK